MTSQSPNYITVLIENEVETDSLNVRKYELHQVVKEDIRLINLLRNIFRIHKKTNDILIFIFVILFIIMLLNFSHIILPNLNW